MCSQQHSVIYGRDIHSLEKHQPVLIAGISLTNEQTAEAEGIEDQNDLESVSTPFLHVYRILSETESSNQPKAAGTLKPPDPYSLYPSYVGDDDFDDGMSLSDVDVVPDAFHSTVLKKFADAIAGQPACKKDQSNENKNQTIKMGNILQSIQIPEFEGKNCIVKHIVPCCDGHHILVNVWLFDQQLPSVVTSTNFESTPSKVDLRTSEPLTCLNMQNEENEIVVVSRESEIRTKESEISICSSNGEENLGSEEEANKDSGKTELNKGPQIGIKSLNDGHRNEKENLHSSSESSVELQPVGCVLLQYGLLRSESSRTFLDKPVVIKKYFSSDTILSCISLPLENTELNEDTFLGTLESSTSLDSNAQISCCCKFAATTARGNVVIFSGETLEVLAKLEPKSDEPRDDFVHLLHCSGIDCLCACTRLGKLHFLNLVHSNKNNQEDNSTAAVNTELSQHEDLGTFDGKMF